jgi:hypothetical protein
MRTKSGCKNLQTQSISSERMMFDVNKHDETSLQQNEIIKSSCSEDYSKSN